MILSDFQIAQLIADGMVENHLPELVNPASLDLRLGNIIMIESAASRDMIPVDISKSTKDQPYELVPGQFILADTMESFNMP